MVKPQKHGGLVRPTGRRKEGFPVAVETKQIKLKDGSNATTYGVDLYNCEIPDRHFHARSVGADYEHLEVDLLFAQPQRGNRDRLRNLLVVSVPVGSVVMLMSSIAKMTAPSLNELALTNEIVEEAALSIFEEAEQTVEVDASIIAAAFSGNEACFDFYEVSPFSMAALPMTNHLNIIPVVRVNTRTSLAMGLFTRLRKLQEQFPRSIVQQGEISDE